MCVVPRKKKKKKTFHLRKWWHTKLNAYHCKGGTCKSVELDPQHWKKGRDRFYVT